MRHSLLPRPATVSAALAAALSLGLTLASCSPAPQEEQRAGYGSPAPESSAAPAKPQDGPPAETLPEATDWEECPYLDTQWLADTNGQRVTKVGVDKRFATPACLFWSYPPEPQAVVLVRDLPTVEDARALVDAAAPIDSTELAEFDGWSGGRGLINGEAVYAVQKDTVAVVVHSNQQQTLKTELIAKEAISRLGL